MAQPLTYEQWLAQQAAQLGQVPATGAPQNIGQPAPAPPPPLMASPTPGVYGPPSYQGAVTQYEASQPQPVPAPQGAYQGMTLQQANTAYQQNVPSWSVPFGQATALEQQRAADPVYQQIVGTEAERLHHGDPSLTPGAAQYQAQQAVLQTRAQNQVPWQEKWIPGEVRNARPVEMAGAAKDALGAGKDALGTVGPIGALGAAATSIGGWAVEQFNKPGETVREVFITRKVDELKHGDPDRTYGGTNRPGETALAAGLGAPIYATEKAIGAASDLTGVGEFEPFYDWLNDPLNAELIVKLHDEGYNGLTGWQAVEAYFDERAGMGGIVHGVAQDPFTYAGAGIGSAKGLATQAAKLPGVAGKVGGAAKVAVDVADAAILDPLKAPGLIVKGVDAVAPGLGVGQKVATGKQAVGNALLTEAGRRSRQLKGDEELAGNLLRAADPNITPAPWLLERDATGAIVHVTDPFGNLRPVVRDLDTGVTRVVEPGDVERAIEIARRLPYTEYTRHMDDWMGEIVGNRRRYGLPSEVSSLFPSRGPEYRIFAQMEAERFARHGQSAIDAAYEFMRTTNRANPVHAALMADRIQSALEISGVSDLSAKARKKEVARIRRTARATGHYNATGNATYAARLASGAEAPRGGTPARMGFADAVDAAILDDDTLAFAEGTLTDRRLIGDVVMDIHRDATRLKELAEQAQTGTLSAWDQNQLDALLKKYGHAFPGRSTDLPTTLKNIADWQQTQRDAFTSNEAVRQIGLNKGWVDKKTGQMTPTGLAASKGPLGKLIRGLDGLTSKYKKYQLYNPLNILRYSGLQLAGNAVTLAIGDFGALLDYAKAIGSRGAHGFEAMGVGGPKGLTERMSRLQSPADRMMQAAGLGRSPFLKKGIKDELTGDDFASTGWSPLRAGRNFAGGFDISLREAAYMHRFQPRYRALQMQLREDAVRTAQRLGVPVSPERIEAALRSLEAGGPYRAFDASQLKQALLDAARDPGMTGLRTNVETWADRVARDWANGVRTLHKDAIANVNRLGFTFDETKLDAVFGRLFMYFYWSSRANLLYTRGMLGNPALLNGYVNTWKTLDREAEKNNAPPWLRGFYGFMQSPMGLTVFGMPTALVNTFGIFNPEILGEGYDANLTDVGKARRRSPFMVNPVIDLLLGAAGVYGHGAQMPNVNPVSTAKLYDWIAYWNANTDTPLWKDAEGNPLPPPYPLRNLGQEAAKIIAEKVSPQTAPILERMGIPADVMAFGDAASSQQQDRTFLMLNILAEQNPELTNEQLNDLLVEEHAGGLDAADPLWQQAEDRRVEKAFAGILEGRDVPNAAKALISAASPIPIIPQVTARLENNATIQGYFQATEDQGTFNDILAAQITEPIRIGGFDVPPPNFPFEIPIGGTTITPEQLAGMDEAERIQVATAWFAQRNPGYDPAAEIPYPDAAARASQIAKAAGPEDLALQEANQAFFDVGNATQNAAYQTSKAITEGTLPPEMPTIDVTIDGMPHTFDNADLAKMTVEERKDLRWLWLHETGQDAELEGYYAARDQLVADNPDLGGHYAMQTLPAEYPGGEAQWVKDAIKDNPSYAQYAERLDPGRYPYGSPDWVKEMLSLEAYQALDQERPASSAPLAWEDVPGAPVIPGLEGASSLNDLYRQQQTAEEDVKSSADYLVEEHLPRLAQKKAFIEEWEATNGVPVGTNWGNFLSQVQNGYQKGVNGFSPGLYDVLEEEFVFTDEEGFTHGVVPGTDSVTGRYILWSLRQPPGEADPYVWNAQRLLKEEFAAGAERGYTTDETGQVVLAPEPAPPPATDATAALIEGYGLTRGSDGSGEFLVAREATQATPSQMAVGNLGATLYQDASVNSQPLLALTSGTPMQVLGESGEWLLVQDLTGLQGWVRRRYLSR